MFCNYCARINPDDAQWCRWCARPVVDLSSPAGPDSPAPGTIEQRDQAGADDTAKKLWFDYLAKINDRELQETRSTGATNWLLIIAAATIIYRFISRLSYFLLIPDAPKNSLVVFLFEADATGLLVRSFLGIEGYCMTSQAPRLEPEIRKRVYSIWLSIVFLLSFGEAALHFYTAAKYELPNLFKWTLVGIGVLWVTVIIIELRNYSTEIWKTWKYKIKLGVFTRVPTSSGASVLVRAVADCFLGIGAIAILFLYLRALSATRQDWVIPLGAATQFLILVAIGLALLKRWLRSLPRRMLHQLEGHIVLEDLSQSQIKSRYITEVLGFSLPDWMESIRQGTEKIDSEIEALLKSLRADLEAIASINVEYSVEKKHRAERLRKRLKPALQQKNLVLKGLSSQIEDFRRILGAAKGENEFGSVLNDLQRRIDVMEASLRSGPEEVAMYCSSLRPDS